jgi:hypothetical protein
MTKERLPMRIKYVETFPDKIEKIFANGIEYGKFFDERFAEVNKRLNFIETGSYPKWKHERITIKKDGQERKYHYPKQLFTKKARLNQEKKFAEYQETRSQKLADKKFLLKNQDLMVAMEFGFKARERGWNLEETRIEFIEELKKK